LHQNGVLKNKTGIQYQIDPNLETLANGVYQAQVQAGQEIESITILKQ
jgi:hypothetical protein